MALLIPEILSNYLMLFRPHFNKPSFSYFSGYILSLLLTNGRKTMSRPGRPHPGSSLGHCRSGQL